MNASRMRLGRLGVVIVFLLSAGCGGPINNMVGAHGTFAMQSQEDKLTQGQIENAVASPQGLKGLSITLWYHWDEKSSGVWMSIDGNGIVTQGWKCGSPITLGDESVKRVLRIPLERKCVIEIVRRFSHKDVLDLPKVDPKLVDAKPVWPKRARYSIRLDINGVGSFEGEFPDFDTSKRHVAAEVRNLVSVIKSTVKKQEQQVSREDTKFLSSKKLKSLIEDKSSSLRIELRDVNSFSGGLSVRLHNDGKVEGIIVRMPKKDENGPQSRRFRGQVSAEEALEIFQSYLDLRTFDLKAKRKENYFDEHSSVLILSAVVEGTTYSRFVELLDGEARETPRFENIRKALRRIGREYSK